MQTITGEDSDFLIHLQGCRQLRKCHESRRSKESSRQIESISHFLTLLGRTTSKELRHTSRIDEWKPEAPLFKSNDTHVEYIYGITPTLGNLLHRTCHIVEALASCDEQNIPEHLEYSRDVLRADLLTWSLVTDDCHLADVEPDTSALEIIRCQARAFHSAVLIFYYRAVEHYHLIDPSQEVYTAWENLTVAEQTKDMKHVRYAAPMSWPGFIAACEAVDRQPWVEWWQKVQRYNLGNFRRQWEIIQEVWRLVDSSGDLCWTDALQRCGKSVLPI